MNKGDKMVLMNGFFKKALVASLLSAPLLFGASFELDKAHSSVGFKVKHLMISYTKGSFWDYSGVVDFDKDKMVFNKFEGVVNTDSIDTDNEKRDDHLRSPDFFDVKKFPEMSFKMTKYDAASGKMYGDMTIKGTTLPVVFEVEMGGVGAAPGGKTKLGFEMSTEINRKDFGLTWNKVLEAGGVAVGDEVKIDIAIEADLAE